MAEAPVPSRAEQLRLYLLAAFSCVIGLWAVITTVWTTVVSRPAFPLFCDIHDEHPLTFLGSDIFLLVCIVLAQFVQAVFRRGPHSPVPAQAVFLGPFLRFSAQQIYNFSTGFQIQVAGVAWE